MGKYLEKSKHDVFVNRFLLRIKVELLPSMPPKFVLLFSSLLKDF